jgi:hypothetical protein
MARSDRPSRRSRRMRLRTLSPNTGGRPRRAPRSRPATSAERVRSLLSRRSSSPKTAVICAIAIPAGVERSTPRSSSTRFHPSDLANLQRPSGVDDAAAEAAHPGRNEGVSHATADHRQGGCATGVAARGAITLDVDMDVDEPPSASVAVGADQPPLGRQGGADVTVVGARDVHIANRRLGFRQGGPRSYTKYMISVQTVGRGTQAACRLPLLRQRPPGCGVPRPQTPRPQTLVLRTGRGYTLKRVSRSRRRPHIHRRTRTGAEALSEKGGSCP